VVTDPRKGLRDRAATRTCFELADHAQTAREALESSYSTMSVFRFIEPLLVADERRRV